MHKVSLLTAAVVAASLVIGVSSASGLTNPETLSFVDVEEAFVALDSGFTDEGAPPLGGRFSFTDGLYEWAGTKRGKRAGRFEGLCTFTKVDLAAEAATSYCVATAFLPRGHLLIAGFLRFAEEGPGKFVVPVLGGTGRYANARGTCTFRDLPSDNQAVACRLVP